MDGERNIQRERDSERARKSERDRQTDRQTDIERNIRKLRLIVLNYFADGTRNQSKRS